VIPGDHAVTSDHVSSGGFEAGPTTLSTPNPPRTLEYDIDFRLPSSFCEVFRQASLRRTAR